MRWATRVGCTSALMLLTMTLRRHALLSLKPLGVFSSLSAASPTVREVCEQSGTPRHLVDGVLEQIRETELRKTSSSRFEVTCVRVYAPPPLEDGEWHSMLLFRGTPITSVEEQLQWDQRRPLFFSSSLGVALPYGFLAGTSGNYRLTLCRVERRKGRQLFNKALASEEDLQLLESVNGDLDRFNHAKAQQSKVEGTEEAEMFDGVVDWLDGGASYCFDADHTRMHTLMCIDTRW